MCDPVSMVAFGIQAGSVIMDFKADQQAAKQQNQRAQDNAFAAAQATRDQHAQVMIGQLQEQQAAGEEMIQVGLETRAAQATAAVAAGEANVAGNSVRALLREFGGRQGTYNAGMRRQQEWSAQQADMTMKGITAQGQDRINSVPTVAPPSFFDAALRIAGAGVGEYGDYKKRTAPTATT